jgi:IS6 family transposase
MRQSSSSAGSRFGRSAGRSWRVDETYIRGRGSGPISIERWTRLGRLSISGSAVVGMWQPRRLSSSRRSDHEGRPPHTITWTATQRRTEQYAKCERTDYYPSARSCDLPNTSTTLSSRTIAGLSSEPDRCLVSKVANPLPLIAGIELLRRIHKGQFSLSTLRLKGQAAPTIWNAVLAA